MLYCNQQSVVATHSSPDLSGTESLCLPGRTPALPAAFGYPIFSRISMAVGHGVIIHAFSFRSRRRGGPDLTIDSTIFEFAMSL